MSSMTGPNSSSRAMSISGVTSARMVGSKKLPLLGVHALAAAQDARALLDGARHQLLDDVELQRRGDGADVDDAVAAGALAQRAASAASARSAKRS